MALFNYGTPENAMSLIEFFAAYPPAKYGKSFGELSSVLVNNTEFPTDVFTMDGTHEYEGYSFIRSCPGYLGRAWGGRATRRYFPPKDATGNYPGGSELAPRGSVVFAREGDCKRALSDAGTYYIYYRTAAGSNSAGLFLTSNSTVSPGTLSTESTYRFERLSDYRKLILDVCGAGGGGGSGATSSAWAWEAAGGGGGGGGSCFHLFVDFAPRTDIRLCITIGAGGRGGNSPSKDNTSGNGGYDGGESSVKLQNYVSGYGWLEVCGDEGEQMYWQAHGGKGGKGATESAAGDGGKKGDMPNGPDGAWHTACDCTFRKFFGVQGTDGTRGGFATKENTQVAGAGHSAFEVSATARVLSNKTSTSGLDIYTFIFYNSEIKPIKSTVLEGYKDYRFATGGCGGHSPHGYGGEGAVVTSSVVTGKSGNGGGAGGGYVYKAASKQVGQGAGAAGGNGVCKIYTCDLIK